MAYKRKRNKQIVYVPLDLIIEILSRLPVKSLLRCKCVCKDWFNLISDYSFVDTHLQRAKANSGFIVETPIPSSNFFCVLRKIQATPHFIERQLDRLNSHSRSITRSPIPHNVAWDPFFFDLKATSKNNKCYFTGMTRSIGDLTRISAACDGLILLESLSKYGLFYVCNPAMHRWVCLGGQIHPRESAQSWGLAFDPSIRKYKAIRMTSRRHQDICEIMIVNENFNSWTEVRVPQPHRIRSFPPVYANSCIHWMIHHRDLLDLEGHLGSSAQSMGHILTMDIVSESFRTIAHPYCRSGCYTLLETRGLLGFANHVSHGQLDLWVLKNVKESIWTKEHSINIEDFARGSLSTKSFLDDVFPLAILENPWRLIFKSTKKRKRLLSYNLEQQCFSKISLQCLYISHAGGVVMSDGSRWYPKVHVNSLACWT